MLRLVVTCYKESSELGFHTWNLSPLQTSWESVKSYTQTYALMLYQKVFISFFLLPSILFPSCISGGSCARISLWDKSIFYHLLSTKDSQAKGLCLSTLPCLLNSTCINSLIWTQGHSVLSQYQTSECDSPMAEPCPVSSSSHLEKLRYLGNRFSLSSWLPKVSSLDTHEDLINEFISKYLYQ